MSMEMGRRSCRIETELGTLTTYINHRHVASVSPLVFQRIQEIILRRITLTLSYLLILVTKFLGFKSSEMGMRSLRVSTLG